jgi:hypothetical protein
MSDEVFDRMEDDVDMESEKTQKTLSTTVRLSLLERDARNAARQISAVIETLRAQGRSLRDIEEWQVKTMLDHVRAEEQQKALMLRLDTMNEGFKKGVDSVREDIDGLRSTWTRIMWTAATPVVAAIVIAVFTLTFGKGMGS